MRLGCLPFLIAFLSVQFLAVWHALSSWPGVDLLKCCLGVPAEESAVQVKSDKALTNSPESHIIRPSFYALKDDCVRVNKRHLDEGVIVSQVADTFVTVAEEKLIVYPSYGITDRQKKRRHLGIRIERL